MTLLNNKFFIHSEILLAAISSKSVCTGGHLWAAE